MHRMNVHRSVWATRYDRDTTSILIMRWPRPAGDAGQVNPLNSTVMSRRRLTYMRDSTSKSPQLRIRTANSAAIAAPKTVKGLLTPFSNPQLARTSSAQAPPPGPQ